MVFTVKKSKDKFNIIPVSNDNILGLVGDSLMRITKERTAISQTVIKTGLRPSPVKSTRYKITNETTTKKKPIRRDTMNKKAVKSDKDAPCLT